MVQQHAVRHSEAFFALSRALLTLLVVFAVVFASCYGAGFAQGQAKPREFKIGVVSFLSGPAAPHSGIPVRQGAELLVEALNAGRVPPPYHRPGIGGVRIRAIYTDEAGPVDKQVTEFRRLVLDEKVDVVVGYISSANCLAIAPIAEELRTLTVFSVCGTQRIFEEADYKYVFRTRAHQIIDTLGLARYVFWVKPDLRTIAGINQDYAWGRDSWETFKESLLQLKPDVRVVGELWPKLFATDYTAEITRLLAARPDVIFSSLWGGGSGNFRRTGDASTSFRPEPGRS